MDSEIRRLVSHTYIVVYCDLSASKGEAHCMSTLYKDKDIFSQFAQPLFGLCAVSRCRVNTLYRDRAVSNKLVM